MLLAKKLLKVPKAKLAQASMRVWVEGETTEGKAVKKGVLLPLDGKSPPGSDSRRSASR